MTTSGTKSFELDVAEYIEEAYERCGIEVRTGYDQRTARRSLNLVLADWANRGLNQWTIENETLPMVPGTIGFIAKALGESLTRGQVKRLEQMVLNNGPVDPKRLSDGERAVLQALMASQGAKAEQQQ